MYYSIVMYYHGWYVSRKCSTPWSSETPERISTKLRIYNYVIGMTRPTCKSMCRCDNVGGLGAHVTCHLFGFLVYTFLIFCLILPLREEPFGVLFMLLTTMGSNPH